MDLCTINLTRTQHGTLVTAVRAGLERLENYAAHLETTMAIMRAENRSLAGLSQQMAIHREQLAGTRGHIRQFTELAEALGIREAQ